jgi:hypothetical protein
MMNLCTAAAEPHGIRPSGTSGMHTARLASGKERACCAGIHHAPLNDCMLSNAHMRMLCWPASCTPCHCCCPFCTCRCCAGMHHAYTTLTLCMLSNAHVQIFEFLDVDGLGSIDLVATISASPDWLDDLDDEVRDCNNIRDSDRQGRAVVGRTMAFSLMLYWLAGSSGRRCGACKPIMGCLSQYKAGAIPTAIVETYAGSCGRHTNIEHIVAAAATSGQQGMSAHMPYMRGVWCVPAVTLACGCCCGCRCVLTWRQPPSSCRSVR